MKLHHRPALTAIYLLIAAFVVGCWLTGCSSPTEPPQRFVVECHDVWGRETTVLFDSEAPARDWKRQMESREFHNGKNPWICQLWTEEEYERP